MSGCLDAGRDMRRSVINMCWLLLPMAGLLALNIGGARLPGPGLLVVLMLLSAVMFGGMWTRALSRRRAFIAAYLRRESPWYQRWRGGVLLGAVQAGQALVLGLVLLVAAVRLEDGMAWRLLLLNLPVLVLLHALVRHLLVPHVAARFLPELAWRLTLGLNFVLLFPALAVAAAHASYPDLAEATLTQAIWHEMARQEAASAALEALMRVAAAKDALAWWLGQQLLPGLGGPLFQLGAWTVLLAAEGLFLWSYLILNAGMLTLVERPNRRLSRERDTMRDESP